MQTDTIVLVPWVLRYSITCGCLMWCTKHRVNGRIQYRQYKEKAIGAPPIRRLQYNLVSQEEWDSLMKKIKYDNIVKARLFYNRSQEKDAGLLNDDCDLSDEDDDHSCEEIKNLLSKIKEEKRRYVELQPEPEPVCINPSICSRGDNVDPM